MNIQKPNRKTFQTKLHPEITYKNQQTWTYKNPIQTYQTTTNAGNKIHKNQQTWTYKNPIHKDFKQNIICK